MTTCATFAQQDLSAQEASSPSLCVFVYERMCLLVHIHVYVLVCACTEQTFVHECM